MLITNYYQPWLIPFLSFRKVSLPPGIARYYYHSFEDGLWDLLQKRNIPRGSTILVPNFYCMDVVQNIQNHGYTPIFYPLDSNFQIKNTLFISYIRTYRPRVVIVFHACGISSSLAFNSNNIIIIEDCVHRLLNPSQISVPNNNHYLIDSLRKVSPLPGSFMYGSKNALNYPQTTSVVNTYSVKSSVYYMIFRIIFVTGMTIRSVSLIQFAHTRLLKHHDDIIGDRISPTRGIPWVTPFVNRLNYERIEKAKTRQVRFYIQKLSKLKSPFYHIRIPEKDYGKLHVYPLGYATKPNPKLIRYLHGKGIVVWFKFLDSPWSKHRGVLFLPLGFHVSQKHLEHIVNALHAWHPPLSYGSCHQHALVAYKSYKAS